MEMFNLMLPATNRFATQFLAGSPEIQRFFHYQYQNHHEYKTRVLELQQRSFMRKELAECIENYMKPFPNSNEVKNSLEKLKNKDSVVVIGGQQAGILTGPLYSIHKIISIIVLARKKEMELNIPVVPVFWIAGEDHDFHEVNHIYTEKNGEMKKILYPEAVLEKRMVSDITLNKEVCIKWVEEIVESYGETKYTNDLLAIMRNSVNKSSTFVDFFSHIVMELFKSSGLLVIDSADPNLRSLEKEIFISQIEKATKVTTAVRNTQRELMDEGYQNSIELSEQAANLFYYDNQERILLEYDELKQIFIGKNGDLQFTKEEFLQIASEFPEKLSNNVVTRPITQELLFPTLAFIAGPGEIAYWAELKDAFELFSIKMPPIVPRLNITLLGRSVQTDLFELGLSIEEVLSNGTDRNREEFLSKVKDEELENMFLETKKQLVENYHAIEQRIDKGLLPLYEKNKSILISQIEFFEGKIAETLQIKHETILNKFKRVDHKLHPLNSPQERILNALPFLNTHGISFFNELTWLNYEFDGLHKVIKI